MSLPKRDVFATVLVALAGALYTLWATDATVPVLDSVRATGGVILALGFAASVSAVVPNFEALIRGNRFYLAATSIVGAVAFAAGLQMLLAKSEVALALLVAAMTALWAVATVHHVMLVRSARIRHEVERRPPRLAA